MYRYLLSLKKSNKFQYGFLFVLVSHLSYIVLGENSPIQIHDNLDSEHVFIHLLKINNHLFCVNPNHTIDKIMYDGFKVSNIHSSLNFINLYYYIFPSYWAYIFNLIVVRIIGFVGFYYLMKKIKKTNFPVLLSLIFSTLPIFPIHGIMLMGIPFLILGILNIQSKKNQFLSYFFLIFYSFYSNFFLGGIFVVFSLMILVLITRKSYLINSFLVLSVSNIIFNYPFIYNFLTNTSHRSEYIPNNDFGRSLLTNLIYGNYHFATFLFIVPFLMLINKKLFIKNLSLIFSYFFIVLSSSLLEFIEIGFKLSRINFYLIPIGFLILINFSSEQKSKKTTIVFLITLSLNLLNNSDFKDTIKNGIRVNLGDKINKLILNKKEPLVSISELGFFGNDGLVSRNIEISYKKFYCEDVYSIIKNDIKLGQSRVLSIGLEPSVALYNDLSTVDGYFNFYSLEHKHNFRKLIKDELNLNDQKKSYYNDWGNRVYFFSSDLEKKCGMGCYKNSVFQKDGIKIFFSPKIALDLRINYVFSSIKISNNENLNLDFINVYSTENCNYSVYVYKINHTPTKFLPNLSQSG